MLGVLSSQGSRQATSLTLDSCTGPASASPSEALRFLCLLLCFLCFLCLSMRPEALRRRSLLPSFLEAALWLPDLWLLVDLPLACSSSL